GRFEDLVPAPPQDYLDHHEDVRLVIDDEDEAHNTPRSLSLKHDSDGVAGSYQTSPPKAAINCRTIDRPKPDPAFLPTLGPRLNSSNMREANCSGMPAPSSRTLTVTSFPTCFASSVTESPPYRY